MESYAPLISLIAPCYNLAHLCDRFFESLLEQTYTNIQLIIVDDGSTDNTAWKVKSYQKALEERGYIFGYVYQKNKGLGGAINTGLKQVRGDFICWADPDDYFEPDAFKIRVDYMRDHPDCAVLTCDAYQRSSEQPDVHKLVSSHFPHTNEPKQFEYLLCYDSIFTGGCHMVRTECFKKVNPMMDIYEARRGQNWQLLLPVYYEYDREFLNVPIYDYVVYKSSMSHADKGYEARLKRLDDNLETVSQTLGRMTMPDAERERYMKKAELQDMRLRMYAANQYRKKEDFAECYEKLRRSKALTAKDRIRKIVLMLKSR